MATLHEVTAAALQALDRSGFGYALAGGLAANLWVPATSVFATYDVDIAVAVRRSDVEPLLARLGRDLEESVAAFRAEGVEFPKAWIDRFVAPPDVVVDVVRAKVLRYAREALGRAREVELQGGRFGVLAPEDVILYKALAARTKDVGPIGAIAESHALDWEYLEGWARRLGRWSFVSSALR